jgi:ribose transport system substrate-binding protein
MYTSLKARLTLAAGLAVVGLLLGACAAATEVAPAAPPAVEPTAPPPAPATEVEEAPVPRWQQPIVIGWTPPDITGVFKTATDFFQLGVDDANAAGFDVELISQSPATHIAFADQVAIIEDYIQREVDVIAISPIELEVSSPW